MAASARPGERATSFAVACSLLSRFVRQNGAAAAELGLGIKGEHRNPAASAGRVCPVVRPGSSCSVLGVGGDFEIWGVQFRFLWGACCEIWAGPWLSGLETSFSGFEFRTPLSGFVFFLLRRGRAAEDAGDN